MKLLKLIITPLATSIFMLTGCTDTPKSALHLIDEYETSVKYKKYYVAPPADKNEIHDEMSIYVKANELSENNDPSLKAAQAINGISSIVQDTIQSNNQLANMKITDVVDSADPLSIGMKYASNWNDQNLEKLRKIADEKIKEQALAKSQNIDEDQYTKAINSGLMYHNRIDQIYPTQEVYKPSKDEYNNYYDAISRSLI